jgi:hypothetical protein
MKYKLIIDPALLKQPYQTTLTRSLLVCPSEPKTVRDLLKFTYDSFEFAFSEGAVKARELYLSTEDDFLLPPNAPVGLALEKDQVIRLKSVVPVGRV